MRRAALPTAAIVTVTIAASMMIISPASGENRLDSHTQLAQAGPGFQGEAMSGQGQSVQPNQPGMMGQGPGMQSGQSGMMGQGMTGQGMMGQGMGGWGRGRRGGRIEPGMMRMGGHMMKVMFAIADLDGDGALSFEEVTAVHRRIFNAVDTNRDGRVTPDEFRNFVQD